MDQEELLKTIYEQHWVHARHVENERLWFTNIFGAIVAGLLVVIFTSDNLDLNWYFARFIGVIIFFFSIIGYYLCMSWRAPFIEHTTLANQILTDSNLSKYAPYISTSFRIIKFGWISAHELFLYFYSAVAGASLFIALCEQINPVKCPLWWISLVAFIILGSLWRGYFKRREAKYRKEMKVIER